MRALVCCALVLWATPLRAEPWRVRWGKAQQMARQWTSLYRLQPRTFYQRALDAATRALDQELSRPGRTPGTVTLRQDIPTVVVSDIHGRKDYLSSVLMQRDARTQQTYLNLLRKGQVQVVLVGDGMHAERRAARRWGDAQYSDNALSEEVAESLRTMRLIMQLKARYPRSFHYLKGNHDNVKNADTGGDRTIYKFTQTGEAELVRRFLGRRFGDDFVKRWSDFESRLPLMAIGGQFVVAHAAPGEVLPRRDIEQRTATAIGALTWTDLTKDTPKQAELVKGQLAALNLPPSTVFLAGHRPTAPGQKARIQGQLVQFNSSRNQYYAVLRPNTPFDPQRDILDATPRAGKLRLVGPFWPSVKAGLSTRGGRTGALEWLGARLGR